MVHKGDKAAPIDLTLDDDEGDARPNPRISKKQTEPISLISGDENDAPAASSSTKPKSRLPFNPKLSSSPRVVGRPQSIDFTRDSPPRQPIPRRRRHDDSEETMGNGILPEVPLHASRDVSQRRKIEPRSRKRDVGDEVVGNEVSQEPLPRGSRSLWQREDAAIRRTATQKMPLTPQNVAISRTMPLSELLSTPNRRDKIIIIDDSDAARDEDAQMIDAAVAALDKQIMDEIEPESEPEPPTMEFGPFPAFTPMPPPLKQFRPFTDWSVPDVPLNYEKIKAAWKHNEKEFRDDHHRYASDKMERERTRDEKAGRAWIEAQRDIDDRTANTQTNVNWWDAPAISTPAVGAASNNAFTFTSKPNVKGVPAAKIHTEMSQFRPKAINVPNYRTYYPVKRSQLVQSDGDLLFWPEATERDEMSEDEITSELQGHFRFRMLASRSAETGYCQMGRQWQPYAEAFLEELNLSEEDMLRFLIDDTHDHIIIPELKNIKHKKAEADPIKLLKDTRKELNRAPQFRDIQQGLEKLIATENEQNCAELKEVKFKYLALAFYAVSSCYKSEPKAQCFNFMYCLNNSESLDVARYLRFGEPAVEEVEYSAATHFDLACRVCHVYPCFVHGLDSMWDYQPPNPPKVDSDDSDNKPEEDMLHPLLDTLMSIHQQEHGRKPVRAPAPMKERPERDLEFEDNKLYGDPNDDSKATVIFPCNHQGACEKKVCHCAHRNCEKSCGCDASCEHRFKGCKCARKGKICSLKTKCACLNLNRECDPDLCGTCGVYDALDPQNRDRDAEYFKDRCQNCHIQKGVPKRTLIGESTVHGIGLFSGEDIKKGELISEYVGAKLNWKQAERGGLYTLMNGYSYLFDMTGDQTVDSMAMGNKTRFMNFMPNKWNCEPLVKMCNTVHRMALYATKDIPAGEELAWDYGSAFFENHKNSAMRKREKAKLAEINDAKKKGVGKKGKGKAKGKGAAKGTISANATRKTMPKEVRPPAVRSSNTRNMVDALEEDGDAGAGADTMDIDSHDDSMDEDFDEEGGKEEVAESETEESDAESGVGLSTRARRLRR